MSGSGQIPVFILHDFNIAKRKISDLSFFITYLQSSIRLYGQGMSLLSPVHITDQDIPARHKITLNIELRNGLHCGFLDDVADDRRGQAVHIDIAEFFPGMAQGSCDPRKLLRSSGIAPVNIDANAYDSIFDPSAFHIRYRFRQDPADFEPLIKKIIDPFYIELLSADLEDRFIYSDSIVPKMLENLPHIVVAIVIVLVLSASMSTLSSLVLTSSSTLVLDLVNPVKEKNGKKPEQKSTMLLIRILIVFFIAVSAIIAIVQVKSSVTFIAQLMGISWGALAGAFLAPFLYSLYSKKISKASVWVSFVCGVGIMCVDMFCNFTGRVFINSFFASPINAGVLAMVCGLVLVPIVSLFTKKPDKAAVDEMFSVYDQTVTVHATTALGDNKLSEK